MSIAIALTASVAGILVAAAVMANGPRATPRPTKALHRAPSLQVPQLGYSCEVASNAACSLHPCVKYAQSLTGPPGGLAVITEGTAGKCSGILKATLRPVTP